MHFFTQYKGLRRENYILFVGRVMTNLGAMIWPVLTMILTQKLGMTASQVAVLMVIAGLVQMPMNLLGGKLTDLYNKKHIIVICDLISIVFSGIGAPPPDAGVTQFKPKPSSPGPFSNAGPGEDAKPVTSMS